MRSCQWRRSSCQCRGNPPTPTTTPIIFPVPSNSRSLTEPIRALSGPSTSLPLNFVNTHWSAPCEVMNLDSDAEIESFGDADWSFARGADGVSDWAIAPEMITPLTAVVIRSVFSIFDLLHLMATCSAEEAIPARHRDVVA